MRSLLLLALLAGTPRVALEVRLVVPCSSHDAGKPVKDPDAASSVCLDRTPFLTDRDVESAEVRRSGSGRVVIFLTFHSDAAMRELQVTLKNVGNRVGIVLNGNLVSAPRISGGSRFLFIDGGFTRAQAEAMVSALNAQARR